MKQESLLTADRAERLARVMAKDRFVASFTHRFLVLDNAAADDALGFDTEYVAASPEALDAARSPELKLVEIVKSSANPFADRISVGRASNCDVVLNDASVSKLHAHFRETDGELHLVDVDSQNGTFVNGERLEVHQARQVHVGDRVMFGAVGARVADAALVYDLVQEAQATRVSVID